jgi:pSer/pThr/pTyr-binding forkhead associated (FHA) protein
MRNRRVSHREREVAVSRLKPRLVDGSLSTDTFSARVESAYTARTLSELREVFADLPGIRGWLARLSRPPERSYEELRLPDTTQRIELSIGRARDCDFVIDEPTVSRHHAVLRRTPEGWAICDIGSTNGTRVNGWRVDEAALRVGDELTIGVSRFCVRV